MRNEKLPGSIPSKAFRPNGGRGAATILIIIALIALGPLFSSPADPPATKLGAAVADHGMVASAHALASQAGIEIMKAGGNAIDAAVATAFAIGVVEPNASGIGGEGMMVLYRADKKWTVAIDYRSAAPAGAKYPAAIPSTGHAAVAIPGTVAGLASALKQYGTMRLDRVMAPAIRLADNGFVIGPILAGVIADNFKEIMKDPPLAAILCPDGLPLEAGATLRNPDLARSLQKIAQGGPEVFYRGEIAEAIVAEMSKNGGFISRSDLADYRPIGREPVKGEYRGYTLVSAPPPVGGTSVIEILQMMEDFDIAKNPPLDAINIHLMSEAMKRGFADFSAFIADPDYVKVPFAGLLSRDYARKRAADIKPDAVSAKVAAGEPGKNESPSTTSLCAVDRRGNIAVLTQTISDFFGAKVVVDGTGIILNNEMKNFSAQGINALAPGKRMRTTIAPTILLKGKQPFAALGTPGAARIISTMVILISNLIDHKMGLQEAIESPRFFARDTDRNLSLESRMPPATVEALTRLGYVVQTMGEYDLFFGGAQGILIDLKTGKKIGGADPRRDGAVIGY
jgi:gamma-glutamyltranspeptidase/glutathione hydrolase